MPLREDGLPRGAHAVHVYPHGKLEKHRTLIKSAQEMIDSFIDSKSVVQVDLGRIVVAKGGHGWEQIGIRCTQKGRELYLVCTAVDALQFITITFRVGVDLQLVADALHKEGFAYRMLIR